jgi:hypothetical protein
MISFEEVCSAFLTLGLEEGMPYSHQMSYHLLSLKSVRILNRLIAFLDSQ